MPRRSRLLGEGVQHRFRPAAEEMLRRFVLSEQIGDEAVIAELPSLDAKMDGGAGLTEILDARGKIGGAHAVVKRDALNTPAAAGCPP